MGNIKYNRTALLKELSRTFNDEELADLCFDLDIDYEELDGSNRRAKARELITYCERRDMVSELIAACAEMRGNIDWYNLTNFRSEDDQVAPARSGTADVQKQEADPVFASDSVAPAGPARGFDGKLKVFLSYASEDRETVRQLYDQLLADGFDPWLDVVKLLPGMRWNEEIEIAVEESHVVIVCLSNASVSKEGYVQKEIGAILDQAERMAERSIFVIPARLQDCELPRRLRSYQAVDLYKRGGYDMLILSLELRQDQLSESW